MNQNKFFIYIVLFSALFIASCAAFFSIRGMVLLFASAYVGIMGSSLELGKVVTISFLYRYWNKINNLLKVYLFVAVLFLMGITSLGIFGFMSSLFSTSADSFGIYTQKIELVQNQKNYLDIELKQKQKRIDDLNNIRNEQEKRISSITNNATNNNLTSIRKLQEQNIQEGTNTETQIKQINSEVDVINNKEIDLDTQIAKLKSDSTNTKDIQTFKFIADAFNIPLNTAVKWFIILIIIVFDPLAAGLILAYNIASFGKINRDLETNEINSTQKITNTSPNIQETIIPKIIKEAPIPEERNNFLEDLKQVEQIIDETNKKKVVK